MDCNAVRDEMLDVLYGEADAAAARRVEEHQQACAACREELMGLRRLRRNLGAWKVPQPSRRRLPWARPPARVMLAAAAAAVLALAVGLVSRGAQMSYRNGEFALRLGPAPAPAPGSDAELRGLLEAQEARHRQEIQALQARLEAAPLHRGDEALLARVQELIRESEERQVRQWNTSLQALDQRTAAQRRYDLARVSAGLSYLDGKTGQHVARTTELMGYVLEAAQKR
jgi:hypothetical protein